MKIARTSFFKKTKSLFCIPIIFGISSTAAFAITEDVDEGINGYQYSYEAETRSEIVPSVSYENIRELYAEYQENSSDYSEDDISPSGITANKVVIPIGNALNSPYVTPEPLVGQTPKAAFARMITNDVLNFGKAKIEDPDGSFGIQTSKSYSDLRWSLWADWINLTLKATDQLEGGAKLILEPDTGTYLRINSVYQKGLTYEAYATLHLNGNLVFSGEVDGWGIDVWTTSDSYVNFDIDFKFTYSPEYNSSDNKFNLNPNIEVSSKNLAWHIGVRTSLDINDNIAEEACNTLVSKIKNKVVPNFVSKIRTEFQSKVSKSNREFELRSDRPDKWVEQIETIVSDYSNAGKYVIAATDRINYLLWSNNSLSATGLLIEAVACDDLTSSNPSSYMNTTMNRKGIDFSDYEHSTIKDYCDLIIGEDSFTLGDATNLSEATPWTEAWGTTFRNTLLSRDTDHNHLPLMSRSMYEYIYGMEEWVKYFDRVGWQNANEQYKVDRQRLEQWRRECFQNPLSATSASDVAAAVDCDNPPIVSAKPDINDYRGSVKQQKGTGECKLEMRTYSNNPDNITNSEPVMIIHGGSWKTRYGSFSAAESYVSHLTNLGYTVYMPFYRLTGKNGDTTEACQAVGWSKINEKGNDDAVIFVQKRHPGQKIKLIGFSAGSNMALNLVQRRPEDISKAVLFYPPTDLAEFYDGYYEGTDNQDYVGNYGDVKRYAKTYEHMAGYLEDFLLIKDFSKIDVTRDYFTKNSLATKISASPDDFPPLYIMHSYKDKTVPWRQSMHLCNAYGGVLGDSSVENGDVKKLEWTDARRKFACNPDSSQPTIFDLIKPVETYLHPKTKEELSMHAFDVDIPGFGVIVNEGDKKELTRSIKSALHWLDTGNVIKFSSPSIDDADVSVSGDTVTFDVTVSHPSGSSQVQSVYAYFTPCTHISGEKWKCILTDVPAGYYSNQLYIWAEDANGNRGVPQYAPPFEVKTVTYTILASAGAGGDITPASQVVEKGYSAEFDVTPLSGYEIDSVTGCNGSLSGNTYTTGTVTANCSVHASFSIKSYTVSTNAGAGGTISPSSRAVNHGGATSFTITPNSGYSIETVSGCNGSASGNTYTTGTITSACTVSATFKEKPVSCSEYTADLEVHLANDRVWSEYTGTCWGSFCYGGQWNIYTKGSDILISHDGKEIHTLHNMSDQSGYWYPGECPITEPVPPVVDSVDTPVVTKIGETNDTVKFKVVITGTASDANGDLKEVSVGAGITSQLCNGTSEFTCVLEHEYLKSSLPGTGEYIVVAYDKADNMSEAVATQRVKFENQEVTCVDYTESLNDHLADDRIWSEYTGKCWGTFCYGGQWNIYTKGSDILIGHDGNEIHTLHEFSDELGTWYPDTCPH